MSILLGSSDFCFPEMLPDSNCSTHRAWKLAAVSVSPGVRAAFDASQRLGPPVVPFCRSFFGEGSPANIDYRKRVSLF